ncbi:NAD-binding D-isomer specific 2-hydroxyacid dehydrogenase [Streptomyces malaysiensis]|uniref:NAD-binding D-isomer specific 2-hydroxyacid dehydrogenase n=2 Tax=Streptomyces malaysiensis TaxID=92644 RepID=A0A7X5XBM8_STRMQ|nr:NAD-binding D-isomer specific 2-hydroxyacid dehydrogenase [Streptomyces malaysiensis]
MTAPQISARTRPRAALAMAERSARQVLGSVSPDRLTELLDLDPALVLDDFTTPAAHRALAEAELLVTGWGCPPLDRRALDAAPRLRAVVHTAGTVRHHITDACWERGISVSSAAAANALPVAEYTVAMILLANKRVLDIARDYRAERRAIDWNERYPDAGNYRRTVGILSASAIGRRVIELLRPYDLDILLYDPYVTAREAKELGTRRVPVRELFARSDVISVHTPLLPATEGLVGRELLAAMPDGATLINTARGAVVDQAALTEEVVAGRIRAVLDVTVPEVLPADSPLYDCDNALITPHIAGSKSGELRRLADLAIGEIENYVTGRAFAHPVRPEILDRSA